MLLQKGDVVFRRLVKHLALVDREVSRLILNDGTLERLESADAHSEWLGTATHLWSLVHVREGRAGRCDAA